ncbi:MAG TPA: hypothetical protein VHO50_07790 [Bacteroidales bacterium]|nr:hypothetical protein [Bacteroidales bacterium]
MKRSVFIFWLSVVSSLSSATAPENPDKKTQFFLNNEINTDPITGRNYNVIIKCSTLQVLFSEAPFSIEIFRKNDISHQFQVGIIFPLEDDSFLQDLFRTSGENSTASENGIFSYRNSPYNNHGLSLKYELRKYSENFYYAPQAMFKYCGYEEGVFRVYNNGKPEEIKESKFSRVIGLGIMAGRQTYFREQALDWYFGIGIRARRMSIRQTNPEYTKTTPDKGYDSSEEKFSLYPFVNLGFRIGIVVW